MTAIQDSALVSAAWLSANLQTPGVKVLDASWYLPNSPRKPHAEYLESHIPGALFFDIETIADTTSSFPNTFPSSKIFSQEMGQLGISHEDIIIVYDREGIHSSPRAWWTFRQFGHRNVFVLDGGLQAWLKAGYSTETGQVRLAPCHYDAS